MYFSLVPVLYLRVVSINIILLSYYALHLQFELLHLEKEINLIY